VAAILSLAVGVGFAQGDADAGAGDGKKPKKEQLAKIQETQASQKTQTVQTTLRLMTYNIHHGEGTDGKFDLERIAELIKAQRPDLVAIQEVDVKTKRSSGIDQAAELGRLTGMHYAFGKFMDYSDGDYGQMVLSKFPIKNARNLALPDGPEPRTALAVEVEIPIKPGRKSATPGVSKAGAKKKTAGAITGASIGVRSKDKKKRADEPTPEEPERKAKEALKQIEEARENLLAVTEALGAGKERTAKEFRALLQEGLEIEQQLNEQVERMAESRSSVTEESKTERTLAAERALADLEQQVKAQEKLVEESREKMLKLMAESGIIDLAATAPADTDDKAAPTTQKLIFVGNHFYATEGERAAQAERLIKHLEPEIAAGTPIILAGDFNSTPGSKPMDILGKIWIDPTDGKDRRTWPSGLPKVEIDYILYFPRERFKFVKSKVPPEKVASDHRPVVTVLKLIGE